MVGAAMRERAQQREERRRRREQARAQRPAALPDGSPLPEVSDIRAHDETVASQTVSALRRVWRSWRGKALVAAAAGALAALVGAAVVL